jgi:integrase/recombinase XerD
MKTEEVIEWMIKGERKNAGKRVFDNIEITEEQQAILRSYNKHLIGHGRPLSSRIAYFRHLVKFVPGLKGKRFEDVTRDNFKEFMFKMHDKKPNTILAAYGALHGFYKWLGGLTEGEDEERYIRILRKERYKPPAGERQVVKAENLPTHEEIELIIKYAPSLRDKAAIAMSYDLGTRPHELFNLNVSDVHFDEYGAVVTVGEHGKTGGRTLRLIYSLPYLKDWLESHPVRDKKDAPLFCRIDYTDFGGRLEPPSLRQTIQKAAKYAGINKRIYSYLFRHASITREAGNGLGDQELKTFYGWTPSSKMLQVYTHLTSDDVNRKRLEQAGVIKPKSKGYELEFRSCPRCGAENPPTHDYCSKCASPLDEQKYRELLSKEDELKELKAKMAQMEGIFEKVLKNPTIINELAKE